LDSRSQAVDKCYKVATFISNATAIEYASNLILLGMLYLITFVSLTLLIIILVNYNKGRQSLKINKVIKDKWSKSLTVDRDFRLISSYYHVLVTDDNELDSTDEDLEIEKLFAHVDRTNSKIGQQHLFKRLKSTDNNLDSLIALDNLVDQFMQNELRHSIELELLKLSSKNAYYLYELFTGSFQNLYGNLLSWYIKFAGILWAFTVAWTIVQKSEAFFIISLTLTLINMYLHFQNKQKIARYVHTLPQLNLMIQVADKVSDYIDTPEKRSVKTSITQLRKLRNSLSFVSFEDKFSRDPSDIASTIWELFKTFLLIEPAMFLISLDRINKQRNQVETIFNYIGHIDFAISIQSLRQDLPFYSKPVFTAGTDKIIMEELYHPLVKDCVPNSIVVSASKGVLITGSNMSGKTTFIRAIAINALLAQSLYTSCTKTYKAPFLTISTSIRISDDTENQTSYFQAEALSVLHILNKSSKENGSLIIIDEIFKGTNTIERVAAAKAILSYLTSKKKFVFVSTHDLELAELLGDEYAVYSFEEAVSEQRLVFDYKLKDGILKNKNAIVILSSLGYPDLIVSEAYSICDSLRKKYRI
jgi:hypothetical protein